MLGCKPATIPIDLNHKLKDDQDGKLIDAGRYQRLVGRLIYLYLTRPNIAYAIRVVSQFMHAPTVAHIDVTY